MNIKFDGGSKRTRPTYTGSSDHAIVHRPGPFGPGVSRREMIQSLCGGIGSIGLAGLLQNLSIEGVSAAGLGRYTGPALPQKAVALEELAGGDAQGNAAMLEVLLDGEAGPRREAVLVNVAVALTVAGCAADIGEGYEKGRAAIDGGAARGIFDRMRKESRSPGETNS